jgi:tRNA U34 2-thiouridine synthase MnmA/TrmU
VVESLDGTLRLSLAEPRAAITPGQSAAVFEGERVLGGGRIVGAGRLQPLAS